MTIDITTGEFSVQWRVSLGPPWRKATEGDFWQWSDVQGGTALAHYAPRRLTENLIAGDDHLHVEDTSDWEPLWPGTGGAWLVPDADHPAEHAEYLTFTAASADQLDIVWREPASAEQAGTHTAGSLLHFWWELAEATGTLEAEEWADERMASRQWQARLQGLHFPKAALRNHHLALVELRWAGDQVPTLAEPTAEIGLVGDDTLTVTFSGAMLAGYPPQGTSPAFGPWQVAFVGWLQDPGVQDDAKLEAGWKANLTSLRGLLDTIERPGVHVGEENNARNGQASASSELANPYKAWADGELVSSQTKPTAEMVIDGDAATPWLSERYLGADNYPGMGTENHHYEADGVDAIHITRYVGQGAGYRWISFISGDLSANPPGQGWDGNMRLQNTEGYFPWLSPLVKQTQGKQVIVVENANLFQQENPDTGDAQIIELRDTGERATPIYTYQFLPASGYTVADWWDSLDPAGGALYSYQYGWGTRDIIPWGTMTQAHAESHHGFWNWSGAVLAAPPAGQTIRRLWANSSRAASGWAVDQVAMPGYNLRDYHIEWWLVKLRPLGLRLRDDIDAAESDLYIESDLGASLDGLPDAGTLQIGNEQISYTERAATWDKPAGTVTRGANGTAAAAHKAGDTVYVVEDGIATDGAPVKQVILKRPAGLPVLKDFSVYGSGLQAVRTPESDFNWDYQADYTALALVEDNALAEYSLSLAPAKRLRYILIVDLKMGSDPYRAALNEVETRVDTSCFNPATNLSTATIAGAIQAILTGAGLPANAIDDAGDTPTVTDYTTDSRQAGLVCQDLADMAGCNFYVERDSKVLLRLNPYRTLDNFPTGTPDTYPFVHLDRSNVKSVDLAFSSGAEISQVELEWRNADNSDHGTLRYPEAADRLGSPQRVGPYICADVTAATALARQEFWRLRRGRYKAVVEVANAPWELRAGTLCTLEWDFAEGSGQPLDRYYMIERVTYRFAQGGLECVLVLAQCSREDEL